MFKQHMPRRAFLRNVATTGIALAAPALVSSRALASSGELNLRSHSGFDAQPIFDAFQADTGIKINLLGATDNDDMLSQAKLGGVGSADLGEPAVNSMKLWYDAGLLDPLDQSKITLDNVALGMPGTAEGDAAYVDGNLYYQSALWGGEGMAYTSDVARDGATASLRDLFDPQFEGQVTLRPHSAMAAMGRLMDAEGKLPRPYLEAYQSEEAMREIHDVILPELLKYKSNVGQFWSGDADGAGAFLTNGCRVGLIWESIGRTLKDEGAEVNWHCPVEGAFGWNQGFVLLKGGANQAQAYEFLRWVAKPENAVKWAKTFQGLSSIKGTDALLEEGPFKDFSLAAYPPEALAKMWWWPSQESWFINLRSEYADKFRSA